MNNRILTAFIVIATCIALSVTLWTSHLDSERADCQALVNSKFLETLRARSVINDGDRDSVRRLFEQLLSVNSPEKPGGPPPTQEQADNAEFRVLDDYFEKQKQLDALREKFKLPEETTC